MNWAAFWGALVGSVVAVLAVLAVIWIFFVFLQNNEVDRNRTQSKKIQIDILESQLEQYLLDFCSLKTE